MPINQPDLYGRGVRLFPGGLPATRPAQEADVSEADLSPELQQLLKEPPSIARYRALLEELAPEEPRLVEGRGAGAYRAGGRVHAPSRSQRILGPALAAFAAPFVGAEEANQFLQEQFFGPYVREQERYKTAEGRRTKRLGDLKGLAELELGELQERRRQRTEQLTEQRAVRTGEAQARQQRMQLAKETKEINGRVMQFNPETGRYDVDLGAVGTKEYTGDLRTFKETYLPGWLEAHKITRPTAVNERQAYLDFVKETTAASTKPEAAVGQFGIAVPESPPGATPEQILGKYPANIRILAKSLMNYKIPLPSSFALANPKSPWNAAIQAVSEADPTWNAAEYPSRLKLLNDFKSGKAAANVRSLNTLIGHLNSLRQSAVKLGNAGFTPGNTLANWIATKLDDPRVTNFEKAANAVEGEAATLFKGTSGTDQEIKQWRATINSSQGPRQLKEGVDKMLELMFSRLDALQSQYETGMGKPADFRLLNDKSRKILQGMGIDTSTLEAQPVPTSLAPTERPPLDSFWR